MTTTTQKDLITLEYNASVLVGAGWRSISITAKCEMISPKKAQVLKVIAIDDEPVSTNMSRTGANRQAFNGLYIAEREIGKRKIVSKCLVK